MPIASACSRSSGPPDQRAEVHPGRREREVTLERSGKIGRGARAGHGRGHRTGVLTLYAFDMFRQQEQGARRAHGGLGVGLALVNAWWTPTARLTSRAKAPVWDPSYNVVPYRRGHASSGHSTRGGADDAIQLDGVRALIVDDMVDMRDFMRMTLEDSVPRCSAPGTGSTRWVRSRAKASTWCCATCACRAWMDMSSSGSWSAATALVMSQPSLCRPSASSADHLRTAAAGFEGHLDKPFADADLLAMVGRYWPAAPRGPAAAWRAARRPAFAASPCAASEWSVRRRCFRCAARPRRGDAAGSCHRWCACRRPSRRSPPVPRFCRSPRRAHSGRSVPADQVKTNGPRGTCRAGDARVVPGDLAPASP